MAILNIKDFPDELYEKIKSRSQEECRSVSQQVIYLLRTIMENKKEFSLVKLRGLGKEVWKSSNVSHYIKTERDSWD